MTRQGWPGAVRLLLGLCGLGAPATALAQRTPFSIADPATGRHAFDLESSVVHSRVNTILPRLVAPEQHESLHDSLTGAKIEEFGTAYSYANPLYGTNHLGNDGVGLHDSSGRSAVVSFVVARFGGPPEALPLIPGIDPSPTQPDVALIRYAMQADRAAFPDVGSARVIDLAMHSMGRAGITQIDIATAVPPREPAQREALLRMVALALVHQGAHPASILSEGRRVLPHGAAERGTAIPGHVFSLVLMDRS